MKPLSDHEPKTYCCRAVHVVHPCCIFREMLREGGESYGRAFNRGAGARNCTHAGTNARRARAAAGDDDGDATACQPGRAAGPRASAAAAAAINNPPPTAVASRPRTTRRYPPPAIPCIPLHSTSIPSAGGRGRPPCPCRARAEGTEARRRQLAYGGERERAVANGNWHRPVPGWSCAGLVSGGLGP
jgi:hypothetical protein